jgi:hypothetical protein
MYDWWTKWPWDISVHPSSRYKKICHYETEEQRTSKMDNEGMKVILVGVRVAIVTMEKQCVLRILNVCL